MIPTQAALEKKLGHAFAKPWLLAQALTHRSFAAEHNERLEFLGDTVLNLAITQCLFDSYPAVSEGDLSRARATLVRQETLHTIALSLSLSQHMRLGDGEIKSGGHARPSMLADMVEALFGAVFLDAGYDVSLAVIRQLYAPLLADFEPGVRQKDAKSLLQETLQAAKLPLPEYRVLTTEGAAHVQTFEILCIAAAWGVEAVGAGASRKIAEQIAAQAVLDLKPAGKPAGKLKKQKSAPALASAQPRSASPNAGGGKPMKQLKLKVATEQTPQ